MFLANCCCCFHDGWYFSRRLRTAGIRLGQRWQVQTSIDSRHVIHPTLPIHPHTSKCARPRFKRSKGDVYVCATRQHGTTHGFVVQWCRARLQISTLGSVTGLLKRKQSDGAALGICVRRSIALPGTTLENMFVTHGWAKPHGRKVATPWGSRKFAPVHKSL